MASPHVYPTNVPLSAAHYTNACKTQLDMQLPAQYYPPRPHACWQNPPPSAGSAVLARMQIPTPLWGRTANAAWQLPPAAVITVAGPPDLPPNPLSDLLPDLPPDPLLLPPEWSI